MYKISFCIPTYNRADYIGVAIESIVNQMTSDMEITICDNGSQDNTEQVIKEYQKKYPCITYFKFAKNAGPDRCFLKTVEMAQGIFCWFLCDDDRLEEGAVQEVLKNMELYPQISGFSINTQMYDRFLKNKLNSPGVCKLDRDRYFDNAHACFMHLFPYFGYLSGQICNRKRWLEIIREIPNLEQYFNAYAPAYIIGKILLKYPQWMFIHKKCVGYRSDNDSFIKELGAFNRFKLDVIGYDQIAKGLFGKERFILFLLNQIGKIYLSGHIKNIKFNFKLSQFGVKALRICLPRYWRTPVFWTTLFPLIVTPTPVLRAIRWFYQKTLKKVKLVLQDI